MMAYIAIDTRRVWPVCLSRHDVEPMLLDQALRDRGSSAIKFRRSVTGFAKKNNGCIAKGVEEGAKFFYLVRRRERFAKSANDPSVPLALCARPF
jgi:hypothetical protein